MGDTTAASPWGRKTPSGSSQYRAWRDGSADPPALMCQVGKTGLGCQLRCPEDLHAMRKEGGDWVALGRVGDQKPAAEGSVGAWGRSPDNPVGGWYGIDRGLRGRYGMYVPPVLELLALAGLEHRPRNNRMAAR